MSYFHATFADRIDSILENGLSAGYKQNFDYAEPGVYLCTSAEIAVGFLLEHVIDNHFDFASPAEARESFRVIVVDRSRLDERLLALDPQLGPPFGSEQSTCWIYRGKIDVRGMPILTVDDIFIERAS